VVLYPVFETFGIVLDVQAQTALPGRAVGYTDAPYKTVTVTNNGTQDTGALSVGLSGSNAGDFVITDDNIASGIAVSASATFTVAPNTGLAVGTYTATVTISGAGIDPQGFDVIFTVTEEAPQVDLTSLDAAIASAKAIVKGNYTDGSWGALQEAIAKAEAVLAGPNATQDEADAAEKALSDAVAALQDKPLADTSALGAAIASAKAIVKGSYTDDSWDALQEAIAKAEAALAGPDATQAEVDAAAKAVTDAVSALIEVTIAPKQEHGVTVKASNSKHGTVTGGGTYQEGDSATVAAKPKKGYRFVRWEQDGKALSKKPTYTFVVTKGGMIEAVFEKIGKPVAKVASAGTRSIKLSWKKVAGATSYEVYRKAPGAKSYKKVATVSAKKTSYTDKKLKTNKPYAYKVRVTCVAGDTTTRGAFSKAVKAKPVPATPTKFKSKQTGPDALLVSWNKVSGATGYQCVQKVPGSKDFYVIRTTKNSAFLNIDLTKGGTYYYKVRAYKIVDGKRVYGKFSKVMRATVR